MNEKNIISCKHLPTFYPARALQGDAIDLREYYAKMHGNLTIHRVGKKDIFIDLVPIKRAEGGE